MNSHRFIEEENAILKERIRVLEEALKKIKSSSIFETCNIIDEALTPQPKE